MISSFILIFWIGYEPVIPTTITGLPTREACIHLAGSIESERRLQLSRLKFHLAKGYSDFTFICEEIKDDTIRYNK